MPKAKDPRQKCIMCDHDHPDSNCHWCAGTGWELQTQDIPVCPHCGAVQSTEELYETRDDQCSECGGWMTIEVNYTPDYSTSKTDPPDVKRRKEKEEYERWLARMKEREAEKAAQSALVPVAVPPPEKVEEAR